MDKIVFAETKENQIDKMIINTKEKTVSDSSYVPSSFLKPYNQDDLWQKQGNYSIYEDMLKDEQVLICLNLIKDLVLTGYNIVSDGNDENKDILEELQLNLTEELTTPFEDLVYEILSAYEFGFSLTEKIFKIKSDGYLALKSLRTRHPDSWLIHTDQKGNVIKYEQRGIDSDLDIKANSLIHFINNPKFQNPYGTSDLRAAYSAYFIKQQVIRYYGIFLESSSKPIPIGKYSSEVKAQARQDLFNTLKKFQTKTALVIPKEMEIEFLEAKSNGEAYKEAINIFNMFIGRSLMCPDLLGISGSETASGSYALGKEQIDTFFRHINRKRNKLEYVINNEIIKPLVKYNYGNIEFFPKFKLKPISEENAFLSVDKWIEATRSHIYKPSKEEIEHFRDIINFPQGELEEIEPEVIQEEAPIMDSPEKENPVMEPQEVDSDDSLELDRKEEDIPTEEKKEFKKEEVVYDFAHRFDYKAAASMLDSKLEKITRDLESPIDFLYNDLISQIEKKKILQGHPERIDTLKLKKLKEINTILKGELRDTFKESKKLAQKDLIKKELAEPLPSQEFLNFLDKETFDAIGDWEYQITKDTRVALRQAILDGKNLSDVINIIEENKEKTKIATDRYARTKLTEVMNKGRLEFFESSNVVAGYEFSAIIDSVTSPICAGLDGKKFKAGNQPIPPLHFNCRSVLIPITIYDKFTPTEKVEGQPIESFIEENKGKGFSKR